MKDAARQLKNKTLTAEAELSGLNKGGSDQLSDNQMNVERLGVAGEMLSRGTAILGNKVHLVRQWANSARYESTEQEVMNLTVILSKPDDLFRDAATAASTWSQPSGLNPE